MPTKQPKQFKVRKWHYVLAFVLAVPATLIVILLIVNLVEPDYSNSQQNITLTQEAANKHDQTICDQIKGGIMPQKQGPLDDFDGSTPMNESEAKERCRSLSGAGTLFRDHAG